MSTTIVGNLTRDPELKFLDSGMALVNFSVAVTRKKGEEEYTSYFDCTAWSSLAENVGNLKKGDRVIVQGSFRQDRFEKDGVKREKVSLLADNVGAELRFASVQINKQGKKEVEEDF